MYSRSTVKIIFSILLTCLSIISWAQQSRETFGKNRIQYKHFDWRFYSSDNFDVYFYDGNTDMAKKTAVFLEGEFDRITDIIGYPPYNKTKVFLYSSVTDQQQSNVGLNEVTYNVSGQTKFIKPYVEVANRGTLDSFKEELVLKISQLLVNEMMFGGSLSEMFQSAYLLNLPEWFVQGASQYIAKGWSEDMDDYARELVKSKKVKKAIKLGGQDAKMVGHSIWNFIAENYGKSNISNILNYTRIIRNEEKSVAVTLGISFKQLMYEWENFYSDSGRKINQSYVEAPAELKLENKNKKHLRYSNVRISPDGSKMAYAKSDHGKYEVKIRDLETGDEEKVISGGYKVINQEVDYDIPLIAWSDDNTLGIINTKQGKNVFWLYDVASKSKLPRVLQKFSQVKSLHFSTNGRLGVVSADVNGQNDIYIISTRRDRTKRLTNDIFDDVNPRFVPNSNNIVFSSNRVTDTLRNKTTKPIDYKDLTDNFNIFIYSLDTTKSVLFRVTNTISKDTHPIALNTNEIFYLSDQKGITNLFKFGLSDGIYKQVSNFDLEIRHYDTHFATNTMAYVMLDGLDEYIYVDRNFNFDNNVFTPPNKRFEVKQAKLMVERRTALQKEEVEKEVQDPPANVEPEKPAVVDTTSVDVDTDIIDTDNYVFDKEVVKEKETTTSFLSQYRKAKKKSNISGPFPYETQFSADNLITSWVIDPLRGFGILLETQMNDMLENHRFYGGIMATTDLRNGDVFAEYQFLKNHIDYSIRYDREVIYLDSDFVRQRYTKNVVELGAALPLSIKSRITLNPFFAITRFENLLSLNGPIAPPVFLPDVSQKYAGIKSEFVYDNSIAKGLNHIEGSRAKLSFKHYQGIEDAATSFSNVSLDIRHYQKIHKELIFATRFFYGKFFGNSPKKYLLGGMDNWLFNDENTQGDENPLDINSDGARDNSDLLFVEYATSLRGFDYAELFGSDVMLFNAELRFPIIRYFHNGPISSNFFRNLQFVGFYDIGSSWTGTSPFKRDNSVNTVSDSQGAFQYTIRNFQNPWLSSYGAGLRTVILGYYMKFDVAWPVEDFNVQSPRLFVTLGYDF